MLKLKEALHRGRTPAWPAAAMSRRAAGTLRGALHALAGASFAALLMASTSSDAGAQQYRLGVDVGVAALSAYPVHIEAGCRRGRGLAPHAHLHYRPHWLFGIEAGGSYQVGVGGSTVTDCGRVWLLPVPGTEQVVTTNGAKRREANLAAEGRLVLTPTGQRPATVRLVSGAVTYPGNSVRGWIAGLGMHVRNSWGGVIVDGERWWLGTRHTTYRVTYAASGGGDWQPLESSRTWETLWQVRLGVLLWSR